MLTIDNQRLHNMIVQKDDLVNTGRAISQQINDIEVKVTEFEKQEKKITAKIVPPKELTDRGDKLVKEITAMNTELTKIANQINQSKLDAVPEEMKNAHMQLLKDKEKLERDRNKIALKVQKIKDKCVPVIQREVKPLLGEYDDIETAKAKDGKIEIETFNHLVNFKKRFNK